MVVRLDHGAAPDSQRPPAGGPSTALARDPSNGALIRRTESGQVRLQNAEGPQAAVWPPELPQPEHLCDLRAVIRQNGPPEDPWSTTGFFYNRGPEPDNYTSNHHGADGLEEQLRHLESLPREERDRFEVGIMHTPTMAPPAGPLRGDAALGALRQLVDRMRTEERQNRIDRECRPLISSITPHGVGLAFARPAGPVGVRVRPT